MNHTRHCEELTRASEFAVDAWWKKWPDACQKCMGAGMYHTLELAEILGVYPVVAQVECDGCLDLRQCPRCRHQNDDEWDYSEPCLECGWRWGDLDGDVSPMEFNCFGECIDEED